MVKPVHPIARSPILPALLGLFLWAASPQAGGTGSGDPPVSGREKRIARSGAADPSIMRTTLLLDGEGSRCLVLEADSLPCVLDAESYNRRVLTRRMFEGGDFEFVRTRILQEALETAFWTRKGREAGIEAPPSVEDDLRGYLRFFNQSESRGVLRRKDFPEDQLRRLYERHYHRKFMAAQDPAVRLLGSSDRSFLERVRQDLAAAIPPGKGRSPLADARLHWVRAMASELPEELASATDTLGPRGHALVSAPFGHFLLRVDSLAVLPEVTFAEASGALRELAIGEDPDLEYRAYVYWQNNRKEFLSPDTLLLAAWLNPVITAPRGGEKAFAAALSRQPHLVLPHTGLPDRIRSLLPADSLLPLEAVLGPVATPLGEWYFQVLSRKRGGGLRPFREVRESVKERVVFPPLDLYRSLEADLRLIQSQNGLALAFRQKLMDADGLGSQNGQSPRFAALQSERDQWLRSLKVDSFPMWPSRDSGSGTRPEAQTAP